MTQLYELAIQYREAAEKLADMDLDAATVTDTLESLSGDLEMKAIGVAMLIRNLQVSVEAKRDAEAHMAARRVAEENRIGSIKAFLLGGMQCAGISKIECPHFRLAVRDNPPAVDIFDPNQLPDVYMKTPEPPPPAPDKIAIKEALKAGRDVPGARLTQGQRLEIR